MVADPKGHPLTGPEIEVYNNCSRTWSDSCFGYGSIKTPPLSDELRNRLEQLGVICGVSVKFQLIDGQHYIFTVRSKTK